MPQPLPVAKSETGFRVLKALARKRTPLAALEIMHAEIGDVFQITLPFFKPAVFVGPTYNRSVLVTNRDGYLWRSEEDPVTQLLRRGLLVEDGGSHDRLRALMEPALRRRQVNSKIQAMCRYTDDILSQWVDGTSLDMLVEMRRIALLILMGALFGIDFMPDMNRLWEPILKAIKYISPGAWIIWPRIPRLGYRRALRDLDEYLYDVIRHRRASLDDRGDLLTKLTTSDLNDDLIRDQMLTLLIAGHDTSTAQLAWTLYLLGCHPESLARAKEEVDRVLGSQPPSEDSLFKLHYLDQVINESLRLFPPIHVGNRFTKQAQNVHSYVVPEGTRVMYSIYLSHRDAAHWLDPKRFMPERFDRSNPHKRPPLTYLPFGGGPRNCIGAAFAQVEAKVVLARILQFFDLKIVSRNVRPHMGATLEPRPGVIMRVSRRKMPHA
jgi:cytochrome P450